MAEAMQLRFAEMQLDGPFRYPAFKHAVATSGDRVSDLGRLRKWEQLLNNKVPFDPTSPTCLVYRDSVDTLVGLAQALPAVEWSTADPAVWLLMRKGIIAANRLVTMPGIDIGDEASLRELMLMCAFVLDCMGRIADADERVMLKYDFNHDLDDNFVIKRALPIYMDIVCGRGGAWLSYIDEMGVISMQGRQGTWWQLRDASAEASTLEYRSLSAAILGVDEEKAGRFIMAQLSLVGDLYDKWQYAMRKSVVSGTAANARYDANAFARTRRDNGETFVDDSAMDMFGYCRMFGASPVACTFDIPRRLEIEVRKERVRKVAEMRKAAQEKARKQFRLPRM